jgi:copper amine oxidase-like protein
MKRILAAVFLGLALAVPAGAADQVVRLTIDGRPVDRSGGSAIVRGGVVYGDLVDLVKSFNGLLTFQRNATVVSIRGVTATFTVGSRTMKLNQGSIVMRGPVFLRDGEPFVPLDAFVTRVANAKLRLSSDRTRADILINANPLN